ncbi:hypothetical protein FB45DRAFT_1021876 [Roridomyces roridus]|uniref:Uncharacterized protein n=1 Tax=Roridomyces roridus TaxID=1738132 RepID=A0AAD7FSR9_9AGAR|nr:hypothetical protein FB45DRAFT_1021876 [Roridomyces roridus]
MSSQSASATASPSRSTSPAQEQNPSPTLSMRTSNSYPQESDSELVCEPIPEPTIPSATPRLPDIISHSSRFAAIQERLKAALRVPAQSGFTDTESVAEDGGLSPCTSPSTVDSQMIHAIYEGLPPSPSSSDDSESVSGGWSSSDSDATQVQSSSRNITPLVGVGLGLRLLFAVPGSTLPRSSTTAATGLGSFGKRPSMARILGYDPGQHRERPSTVLPTGKPIHDNRRSRYAGLGHGLPSHMPESLPSVRTITQALYAETGEEIKPLLGHRHG